MKPVTQKTFATIAEYSRTLSPEAANYWTRHEIRFAFLIDLLASLRCTHTFSRILDVGMSFETILLCSAFDDCRIDCLGLEEDSRFRPPRDYTFYEIDLNNASLDGMRKHMPDVPYDVVVCMEVLEHLTVPPSMPLQLLGSFLRPGGLIVVTTPNAAWLKNRLKLMYGKNPFEMLSSDPKHRGHVREYTKCELEEAFESAGFDKIMLKSKGLYQFDNAKDRFYSRLADALHPSLRRTIVAVYKKPRRSRAGNARSW